MSDQNSNPPAPPAPQNSSAPSTNAEFELLKRQMNELQGMVGNIAQAIQSRPAPAAAPEPSYQIDPNDWADPEKQPRILAGLIAQETQKAVAPLNEFRQQFTRQTAYQSVKQQVRVSNPMFTQHWDKIEPFLDQTFASGNVDVNQNLVAYQANAVIGMLLQQNPALFLQQNQAPNSAPAMIDTSSATPPEPPKQKLRPLTEAEALVAKQRGLTHEEYLQKTEGGVMIMEPSWQKTQQKGGK